MGGRPQKREKASGRKRLNLGSTWNVKRIHVGMLLRLADWPRLRVYGCPVVTLSRWDGFTVGRVYGFTLGGWNVKRVLRC